MSTIQALRGTRDILPDEIGVWQHVEATAREILHRVAYREIRPPMFEQTELFARGIGEATDVVGKEMYSFEDRGGRSITLRPEITAGLVRAFISNKLFASGGIQRLWHVGPAFRYERPQKGRQRQFHQLDVEILGSRDPRADVEVIAIATDLLKSLGLKSLTLDLNSVGSGADRQAYRDALVSYLTPYKDELDTDSQDRLTRNPLRILDSKNSRTQAIVQDAPSLLEHLSDDSQQHFDQVQQQLSALGIDFTINPRLVRGLDYYTHTAFEIMSADLGAQATVCGGGRYDGLVQQLGGPDVPAIGFAIGLERLTILLQQLQNTPAPDLDFYIVSRGEKAEPAATVLAQKLRHQGFSVEVDLSSSAFGKQFKRADRSGATGCLILGDAEAENGAVQLKWLSSGEQSELSQKDLIEQIDTLKTKIATLRHP
ncbi:histidine--tRNA ligase [Leptolyngbya cf. ectocarpi LEGE 11479]|uniref:Histidine--tRNA ligase n=1 Tax=Leptolyngbya cf. ectocarpi LEGE 11479 TaxID=1828722 RepID=A0A929FBB0_LEPEC|nr:histidine--tRNA ligase [Leptolyngbya ectocarpi]MBE9068962.1 histidine--tRNA ligase [Leptolyngbya cf. ectocarpi LEGE 11479]